MSKVLKSLRTALDAGKAGPGKKIITYTSRFNSMICDVNRPDGYTKYPTDCEGGDLNVALINHEDSALWDVIDAANIMMYDVDPKNLLAPDGFTMDTYKAIL